MKKYLWRAAVFSGTLGVIVAGAAAFSAFEAHVVNVTATIENALTVPQELSGITFGTIFPEEVAHKALTVSLSDSFLNEPRVDDVSYFIRQKPKCVSDTDASVHPQVTEDGVTFVCPAGSHLMPLLCPYLSKHLLDGKCDPNAKKGDPNACYGIDAFHGDINNWTATTSETTDVGGHLVKGVRHITDNWDIDLHAPCFKGQCAQDNVIPASFQPDPKLNGKVFGCDLWVEVNGISLQPTSSTLTIFKHVINDSGTGTSTAADFTMHVNGTNVSNPSFPGSEAGVTVSLDAGAYNVTESGPAGYTSSLSADCSGTIAAGASKVCTITNDDVAPEPGHLTVTKVVVNTGGGTKQVADFPLFVDGSTVVSGVSTTTSAGSHTVTETSDPNYSASFSGDCNGQGVVNVPAGGSASCTLTNTFKQGGLIVHKIVVGSKADPNSFTLKVDGSVVVNNNTSNVAAGSHVVSEVPDPDYTTTFGNGCDAQGNVTVPLNGTVTCDVTNTRKTGTLTVHKVVSDPGSISSQVPGDFQLQIDGINATQGSSTVVTTGPHTVSEVDSKGDTVSYSVSCPNGIATVTENTNTDCTITNTVPFGKITVVKIVSNTHGGSKVAGDFTLEVIGNSITNVTNGVKKNFAPGSYDITEVGVKGYQASFSGACDANGHLVLNANDDLTCTITNQDLPGNITMVKVVSGPGSATPSNFIMRVNGAVVPSGASKAVNSNTPNTITEDANILGYNFTSMVGTGDQGSSCPAVLGGTATLHEGENITCTITNTHP